MNRQKMHGSIQPLLRSISGFPIHMLDSPNRNYSLELVLTLSSTIALEVAKSTSAIGADAQESNTSLGVFCSCVTAFCESTTRW